MTIGPIATVAGWNWRRLLARQRRLLVAITAFLVIFIFVRLVSSGSLSYFELSSLSTNTGALALAAMGETVVFLLGGIDLSAGATLSLVNVTLASQNWRFLFIADHDGAHGARDRRFGRRVQWFFCCLHASPSGGRDAGQHVHSPQSQSLDHAQSRRPCARGPVQILHG